MGFTLKDLVAGSGVDLLPSDEEVTKERELKHRNRTVLERPKEEYSLKAIYEEDFVPKKKQTDPTPDLVFIDWESGTSDWEDKVGASGYIIWCADTNQIWFAPTKDCLDANFIYRTDLEISEFTGSKVAIDKIKSYVSEFRHGVITRKTCYILDMPGMESYEVYYKSNYPSLKYGKATPNGSFIHSYANRFERDMAILELDKLYSGASKDDARKMTKAELKPHEAIVISDGAWLKEQCSSSVWYLDSVSAINLTEGIVPSDTEQAVLIAELRGAINALQLCYVKKKKKITYYYDNTSILNIFKNRKTEYIAEVVEYKELLEKMASESYSVKFVELHPKTGEDRDNDNHALMFFHNDCDGMCRKMADIFKKDYKAFAASDDKDGKTYQQVKEEFKPKGRPGQSNGRKPGGNYSNGNNRYGKRY